MPKQALLNGTLEDANDFDGYNELDLIRETLEKNSWTISEIRTERAGYNFIRIANGDKELSLHIYLKKVMWRHRSEYEKGIQFPADHIETGYEVEQTEFEKTVILGIYSRDTFADYLVCAWQPSDWGNRGRAFNCFIDVQALADAFQIGFTNDHSKLPRKVFSFRPEFIHYYLLNKESLHLIEQPHHAPREYRIATFPYNLIYFGAPGTGKSNAIADYTTDNNSIKITFHPDTDYAAFVGSYKPKQVEGGDQITYGYVEQAFLQAYTKAWETDEDTFLIIEEINRGNCAQIFGDIFQLIERGEDGYSKYKVDVDTEIEKYLRKHYTDLAAAGDAEAAKAARYMAYFEGSFKKIALPDNLFIHATMNTSDQSLFPIDSAFKRRWDWEYVPIEFDGTEANNYQINIGDENYSWRSFIEAVNLKIKTVTDSEDKKLGQFFIKSFDNSISEKAFKAKVLFYIWNDILKDEPQADVKYFFRRKATVEDTVSTPFTFSDLFSTDSTQLLKDFMKYLDITITPA